VQVVAETPAVKHAGNKLKRTRITTVIATRCSFIGVKARSMCAKPAGFVRRAEASFVLVGFAAPAVPLLLGVPISGW
jgi:hypothetical protein